MTTKLPVFSCLLFLLLASPAIPASTPHGSHFDSRIQYIDYNDGDVVVIRSEPGYGTRVVFAPGEHIQNVATGFLQGWQLVWKDNQLYIKPKSVVSGTGKNQTVIRPEEKPELWTTNIMVTTALRLYDFDLRLVADRKQGLAYRIQFHYPLDEQAARIKDDEAKATKAVMARKPAPRNWNYTMQVGDASESIAPTMAYDDGRFTYLRFPNNRDFPAVFMVAADKSESLVNTHTDKDILVIQRVAKELVLRLGNEVVGVYNEGYDKDGLAPTDGTSVPGVKRVIKEGHGQ